MVSTFLSYILTKKLINHHDANYEMNKSKQYNNLFMYHSLFELMAKIYNVP